MTDLYGYPITSILIVLSIVALWHKNPIIWQVSTALAVATGLLTQSLSPIALISVFVLVVLLWVYRQLPSYGLIAFLGVLLIGLILGLHLAPGFNNYKYLDHIQLSEQSAPFSIWFNYDKSLFGLLALGIIFHENLIRTWSEWVTMAKQLLPIIALGFPIIYCLGIALGYAKIDLSITVFFLPWALKNLFFTVIAEEILFRGLIQKELNTRLQLKHSAAISIVIGGLLFGCAHYAGGLNYVLLSSVAGCLYGLAYHITGKIEAAILTHFLLNVGHFILFSYPYLIS